MSLLLSREARELAIFLEEKWLQNLFGNLKGDLRTLERLGLNRELLSPQAHANERKDGNCQGR